MRSMYHNWVDGNTEFSQTMKLFKFGSCSGGTAAGTSCSQLCSPSPSRALWLCSRWPTSRGESWILRASSSKKFGCMSHVQPPTSSLMRLSRKLILLSPGFPLLLLLLLLTATQSDAAPAGKAKVFGPCVGMDCMHGVLMHGDAKAGDSHGVEDAEKRREELQRANAAAGEKPGQLNQEEFLHGVLMHGDAKAGSAHSHDPAPTVEKRPVQNGPMNQEDLMHGVLMHGDSNPDHKHRHSQADQAALKAGGATDGVPGVESRPSGFADSEDEGLLGRWWRTLKYLVTGSGDGDSGKGGSRPTSAADFNLMQDLAAVGSTKTVAELDQAAGHSHRDTDKVHRERDRREHANTVHVEH